MVGNTPNFSKIDVLRCFLKLDKKRSRQELSKELSLGEGTIRSILEILKSKNLQSSDKKGHFLNEKGNKVLESLHRSIENPKEIKLDELPEVKCALLIKTPKQMPSVYKLRDIAVRNGAEGAVIFKFNKRLEVPGSDYEEYFKKLENRFKMQNGNVLIVAFSKNQREAQVGALSIALELSNEVGEFLKEVD